MCIVFKHVTFIRRAISSICKDQSKGWRRHSITNMINYYFPCFDTLSMMPSMHAAAETCVFSHAIPRWVVHGHAFVRRSIMNSCFYLLSNRGLGKSHPRLETYTRDVYEISYISLYQMCLSTDFYYNVWHKNKVFC